MLSYYHPTSCHIIFSTSSAGLIASFLFHDLVLISHSDLSVSSLLSPSKLSAEAWPSYWTLASLHTMRRKLWQVPQELAGVCRWAGCWPAKLISHSPGTHNASRVTMGINRRSERDGEMEGEILGGKYSRTASVSLGCRFWPWRPAARFWLFIHSPHFNTWCKGNAHWRTRSQLPVYRRPFRPGHSRHNQNLLSSFFFFTSIFSSFFPLINLVQNEYSDRVKYVNLHQWPFMTV